MQEPMGPLLLRFAGSVENVVGFQLPTLKRVGCKFTEQMIIRVRVKLDNRANLQSLQ